VDLIERPETVQVRHPWELVRGWFFLRLFERLLPAGAESWLDVGAGDGWLASRLRAEVGPEPRIVCWDINYTATSPLGDGAALEFTTDPPRGRFDVILMLDVIEHVEDDQAFLSGVLESHLADGGHIVVSVPAYMRLYTSHDTALHHYRRYAPGQCRRLLERAGVQITAEGGLFHSLLPVRAGQAALEKWRGPGQSGVGIGEWRGGRFISTCVLTVFRLDTAASLVLGRRRLVAPGLSYWAVGRKAAPGRVAGQ
jgi:hypothetical protein